MVLRRYCEISMSSGCLQSIPVNVKKNHIGSGTGCFFVDVIGQSCFNSKILCARSASGKIRQENLLLYLVYQSVGTILYLLSLPFVLLANRFIQNGTPGVGQRYGLGLHRQPGSDNVSLKIWIHASSVGEVQAARVLIDELRSRKKESEFFLTTMTKYGQQVARRQLPPDVQCSLAPLDVPLIVRRFLSSIEPVAYICLETELWPAMFMELHRSGVTSVVLNGRISERSLKRYLLAAGLMQRMLGKLDGLAAITSADGERFRQLGVPSGSIRVTGNIKYDYPETDPESLRQEKRRILQVERQLVLICGSTRTGEEEILLPVYETLRREADSEAVLVLAPRHLERLDEVRHLLTREGYGFDCFSTLTQQGRSHSVVLLDTMGDLGELYCAGDFNFIGGSLVDHRGHNIMEAARWGRPVYYGSSIGDFQDAAELLEKAGGGFRVKDADGLASLLICHYQDKGIYEQACASAARAVASQRGAAGRQVEIVLDLLPNAENIETSQ